ncbi:hypothetical protein [Paenibacillus sedimenti]|uniref:Uncharacterized protein n=1 Tax=Paenibacillus sedimenti TaxID=2770274 RepID=A0A926KV83_9BACL|nr:hypothetical protein [Paenibacillus sedimenti]MBD0382595.1 hypothetical protein [Paenibacillus sedimenti]
MTKPVEQELRPQTGVYHGGGPGPGHGPGYGYGHGPWHGHGWYPKYGYGLDGVFPWVIPPYLWNYPYPPTPPYQYPYPPYPYYPPYGGGVYPTTGTIPGVYSTSTK